jgi:hypothetical protein
MKSQLLLTHFSSAAIRSCSCASFNLCRSASFNPKSTDTHTKDAIAETTNTAGTIILFFPDHPVARDHGIRLHLHADERSFLSLLTSIGRCSQDASQGRC